MPKATLTTKTAVDAIPYSEKGQAVHWDTELTGFGILAGARQKTFILERRINGKPRRVTLGRVGEITLQKAKGDAEQLIGEMRGGSDPVQRQRTQTAGGMTLREGWELTQETMRKKNRAQSTFDDYQSKIDCHLADWLDLPLADITPEMTNKLHSKIGEGHGKYMANGTMRVLRLIWRRVRRQHRGLPEAPTSNVDFYAEHGRTNVIKDWPAWWAGIEQIANPVRRSFYIFLAFSGCRAGETMRMEVKNLDLDNGIAKYPITKTIAFELPLSDFMVELLRNRIAGNVEQFGADCRWVFPSITSKSGHLEEEKLIRGEPELFKQHWSPHTLRHSWITISDQKVKISDSHQRLLTNHKLKRVKNDAHSGYIHPDLDDLRVSQQTMTDYILAQIKPKPSKGQGGGSVVKFQKKVA
ncbi:integrase [Bradyrhizobium japonicum]|uniref:tyrosine-type recombinase/integrase n=1 Tax=Bradyrhizobium liaoningense TaxID=43992 RepID=UPI001BAE37ED|nr:integrase family protein [Bradyrhizobium liaoningense]MBR1070229.1 integrase family protein [Bradyrhizobium liaoningense]